MVIINLGHSPFSPGAVWEKRTEHRDVSVFGKKLQKELSKNINSECILYDGRLKKGTGENDIILSFHRDSNMKNCCSHGAKVLVQRESDKSVQYKAYRLLDSLCGNGGFRYCGVHTFTEKCPLKSIEATGSPCTFVFYLGYIDSSRDNAILDGSSDRLIKEFSKILTEIIKERENEATTAFSETSFRGKQFPYYKN